MGRRNQLSNFEEKKKSFWNNIPPGKCDPYQGGAIKGKSQTIKKAKTGGGSPPYLGPITLNNPWSILKKNPGTGILLLRSLVCFVC